MKLQIGEIVSWSSPAEVPFRQLRDGLTANGFDEALSREMLPRNAFRRAAHEMEVGRVIRKVVEGDDEITFQFTKEAFDQMTRSYSYSFETNLKLMKNSGLVMCSVPELQVLAQALVDAHVSKRNANDVTRVIQKIFAKQGDLFPVRKQGGVYFVPQAYVGLADRVEALLKSIGGDMTRFECGGTHAEKNVAQAMDDEFQNLIRELDERINGLSMESSTAAIITTYQRIDLLRAKIAAYKDLLKEHSSTLDYSLDVTRQQLDVKVNGTAKASSEVTPDTRTSDEDKAAWADLLDTLA